ncbi:MAG: MBL fold metallo-hydrolase [Lentisphaerae bacterium]|nr:MBL fold metallo-hydrolase [Lentisphaerota bacterium]
MPFSFCVLASGSSGNCIYVESGATRLLVDAGLSCRETGRRLAAIGRSLDGIQAVCVTHDHSDHTSGLRTLHSRYGVRLYANAGTCDVLGADHALKPLPWTVFTTGSAFDVGDIHVEPFSVPHDAAEPVGFILESGGARVGIVTDIGMPTHLVRERLRACRALIMEANHDERLLEQADRPWALKQRIAGRQGHLSNRAAAEMIAEIAGNGLTHVFLAHLSSDCNRPELALETVRGILRDRGHGAIEIKLTHPDRPGEMWSA